MKSPLRHTLAAAVGGLLLSAAPSAEATITFNGGNSGDLFFLYDSVANNWVTVFRAKGAEGSPTTTGATGLTNPFNSTSTPSTWPGILGNIETTTPGNTGDYLFNTLQMNVSSVLLQTVNGNDYFITSANGSSIYNSSASNPDLGIRIRLREDQEAMGIGTGVVEQFANLRLSLDWDASTKPLDSDFVLFGWDGSENPANVLYDTSTGNAGDRTHDWGNWGHNHWHYGFSEVGDYTLVFNIEGIGGEYGSVTNSGQVSINFSVIPEPSTALLSMLALGALGFRRSRS